MIYQSDQVVILNDAFRQAGPGPGWSASLKLRGEKSPEHIEKLFRYVARQVIPVSDRELGPSFEQGHLRFASEDYIWRLHYYEPSMMMPSSDPADPSQTVRHLSLMDRTEVQASDVEKSVA